MSSLTTRPLKIEPTGNLATLTSAGPGDTAAVPDAIWYTAHKPGDGLIYRFDAGGLENRRYLTCDMLLDGRHLVMFELTLQQGEAGPRFALTFGLLIQCQARLCLPLSALDQNQWLLVRRGGLLKAICRGDRVDAAAVDRATLLVHRMAEERGPVHWCATALCATRESPPELTRPVLPRGALLDELGQLKPYDWPGKSRSHEQVRQRLHRQLGESDIHRWPASFDGAWGGWRQRRFEGTGYFRTHHDGQRWWLVDPAGHAFWSTGPNVVEPRITAAIAGLEAALSEPAAARADLPEACDDGATPATFDYLRANLIRAFGARRWRACWEKLALGQLRAIGFNTLGNWSDWRAGSRLGVPYVRGLRFAFPNTPTVFRDFPDVFEPRFVTDAQDWAGQLHETRDDPAMVGYFLTNEPKWAFADFTPAEGMLCNGVEAATRRELAQWLGQRYGEQQALARAWGLPVRFAEVASGPWRHRLTDAARRDLAAFSTLMARRLFQCVSELCGAADPNHLNLGVRYHTLPPAWSLEAMQDFDVFSLNCYRDRPPADMFRRIERTLGRPVIIGEWHFGALDVGLPASGIGRVADQAARGLAYRHYLEHAAADPACVGAHWFTLYDQSALGRHDGEAYNIGFLDVTHRPYDTMVRQARAAHERLYAVAAGEVAPADEEPQYLGKLF